MSNTRLRDLRAAFTSPVEKRLFAEYGAIFLTKAVPPPTIRFADSAAVEAFQSSLATKSARFGEHDIELQAEALDALVAAAAELTQQELTLSARAADSGRRSYAETVALWRRNVTRGLAHWQELGRLEAARADEVLALETGEQVAAILDMEEREELYCGTFFNRSILYSVAAPGASQHLSLLAFDVAEYRDAAVETALNACGWHRTVIHDLPHFTYLGYTAEELAGLDLQAVTHEYGDFACRYFVPRP